VDSTVHELSSPGGALICRRASRDLPVAHPTTLTSKHELTVFLVRRRGQFFDRLIGVIALRPETKLRVSAMKYLIV